MQNTKHKRVQPCNLPSTTMRNTYMSREYDVGPLSLVCLASKENNLPPRLLLENASIMAETNFTFGQQNLFIYSYYNGPILP